MGKHKKIKAVDPFYFGNRKQPQNRNTKVVNQAPKNTDVQEVPRRLRELMQWKQQGGKGGRSKKGAVKTESTEQQKGKSIKVGASTEGFPVQRVGADEPVDGRPVEKVPDFTQKPWESEKRFVERMHMATQVAYEKAKWMPDIDPLKEEEKKQKAKTKQHVNKKKEKLKAKRKEKAEEEEEQRRFTDHVQFGEVVSQPPELTARPRKAGKNDKPGKKTLLLNSLLSSKGKTDTTKSSKQSRKRKNKSAAEQRMLDAERERVIQAYRTAKKAKLSGMSPPPAKKIIIGDL
ncbi:PREDICTED: coiled-coil domain-containing protein 137-like [Branchiostoma belcheri]|uniref:Coiled-coil domain-containing protein 137-like n=1 Tax=Branchiostoma belcheri TaxID=7741 RepID=A0A6P5AJ19_BRABE|nr:PREDICTED: coiled-coil domain-containing protein 137-like [Branchiostoma belcheri]